jgi:hypothetical protein
MLSYLRGCGPWLAQFEFSGIEFRNLASDARHGRGQVQLGISPILPCRLLDLAVVRDLKKKKQSNQNFNQYFNKMLGELRK